jgi:hypothetical protein
MMTAVPFMHAGLLVEDLEDAIGTFAARLAVPFTAPMISHLDNFQVGGSSHDIQVRCAYSRVGPPFYELIECHDEGLFGRGMGLGLHHVGLWESDCEAKLDELTASGLEVEGIQYAPGDKIVVAYFAPSGLEGMRVELVNEAFRSTLESWATG